MADSIERPRVRLVEAIPIEENGERLVLLRDPLGFAAAPIGLSEPAAFIVSLCDGSRTARELQVEFTRRYGSILFTESLSQLLHGLDASFYLEGERFENRVREIKDGFAASPVREPAHAGVSYPDDPEKLRPLLYGWLDDAARRLGRGGSRAVIAPHIDLRVGGAAIALAYAALEPRVESEVFFVLGTAHASPEAPIVLTRKAYGTPLGSVPTDEGLVMDLASRLPFDPFAEELVHRTEHSVEFQSVFLRAIAERRGEAGARVRMVPILCGSLHEAIGRRELPESTPAFRAAAEAIAATARAAGASAAFVAGADLSHVGSRFGDPEGVTPSLREAFESVDHRALEAAGRGDAEGFFRTLEASGDRYRVCGISPIYLLLRAAGGVLGDGRLLAYEQMNDGTGTVSYASVAFDPA